MSGDLFDRAREIAEDRQLNYGDWKHTAARYCPTNLERYPADMIRAKLARDPNCTLEDTRVDLVNYLAMLDELNPFIREHDEAG